MHLNAKIGFWIGIINQNINCLMKPRRQNQTNISKFNLYKILAFILLTFFYAN